MIRQKHGHQGAWLIKVTKTLKSPPLKPFFTIWNKFWKQLIFDHGVYGAWRVFLTKFDLGLPFVIKIFYTVFIVSWYWSPIIMHQSFVWEIYYYLYWADPLYERADFFTKERGNIRQKSKWFYHSKERFSQVVTR